jgi:hypothetical protein
MSDTIEDAGKDFLEHYGILGMHWGIRNDYSKGRINWKRNLQLNEKVNKGFRQDLETLNNDPRFAGQDVSSRNSTLGSQYDKEALSMYQARLDELNSKIPKSRDGSLRFQYRVTPYGSTSTTWTVRAEPVPVTARHADDNQSNPIFIKLIRDDNGFIVATEMTEDFLEHYGVLGMRWGIRRENLSEMSDSELQSTIKRMQLEKQYRDISRSSTASAGAKFIANHANKIFGTALGAVTTAVVQKAVRARFG